MVLIFSCRLFHAKGVFGMLLAGKILVELWTFQHIMRTPQACLSSPHDARGCAQCLLAQHTHTHTHTHTTETGAAFEAAAAAFKSISAELRPVGSWRQPASAEQKSSDRIASVVRDTIDPAFERLRMAVEECKELRRPPVGAGWRPVCAVYGVSAPVFGVPRANFSCP